ncbi:MAG: hypothetical protein IKQ61_04835 [Spirochaetales bacterium]|nr:hypothetical protein [Spirochaetales bacterium]
MTMKVNVKLPTYAKELGEGKFYGMAMYYYQCSKCGTTIPASTTPRVVGCPAGGFHKWNRL